MLLALWRSTERKEAESELIADTLQDPLQSTSVFAKEHLQLAYLALKRGELREIEPITERDAKRIVFYVRQDEKLEGDKNKMQGK